jgi:hypothetical protein
MSEGVDLEIVLKAKGVEVATSRDAGIWLTAMGLISGATVTPAKTSRQPDALLDEVAPENPATDIVAKFAEELAVQPVQLEGAAGPSSEPPFIHLDHKYWAALRGSEGTKAVAPAVVAATLLLLWDRHAKIGDVTTSVCANVLNTIDLVDHHALRAIKRCEWLQVRSGLIKLNPALIGKAEALARKYCTAR